MSFKHLSIPTALAALVLLSEAPLAFASRNNTRLQYFAQDLPSSNFTFTVSSYSGLLSIQYETDCGLGVQFIGASKRYEDSKHDIITKDSDYNAS
jgi:hypothetical protein